MKYDVHKFEHPRFGELRIITTEGETWFFIADVRRALEDRTYQFVIYGTFLGRCERWQLPKESLTDSNIEEKIVYLMSERGLLSYISTSPLLYKKHDFLHWVTHVVFPLLYPGGDKTVENKKYSMFNGEPIPDNRDSSAYTDTLKYLAGTDITSLDDIFYFKDRTSKGHGLGSSLDAFVKRTFGDEYYDKTSYDNEKHRGTYREDAIALYRQYVIENPNVLKQHRRVNNVTRNLTIDFRKIGLDNAKQSTNL